MSHRIIILGAAPDPELLKLLQERFSREEVIDETESVPVLTDEPEDPEVIIETLQARILHLEAELEEHRRSVDGVLEALRGLGTPADIPVTSETSQTAQEPVGGQSQWLANAKKLLASPSVPVGMSGREYLQAAKAANDEQIAEAYQTRPGVDPKWAR